jgi:hypothetical protein
MFILEFKKIESSDYVALFNFDISLSFKLPDLSLVVAGFLIGLICAFFILKIGNVL